MIKQFNKYLLLINSLGNKKHINLIIEFLSRFFSEELKNNDFLIKQTEDEFSTGKFSKEFSEKYYNSLIISAGGDGTVHEIVNSINFSNTSLAILPNGTGNDFATFLYGGMKLEDILNNLDKATFIKSDLLKVNDYYCINVTSFGYETKVLAKAVELKNRYSFLGNFSFILAVPLTIKELAGVNYDYELRLADGEVKKGSGTYIINALCNGSKYGGGFTPAPSADITDGIIDFNQVENISFWSLFSAMIKYKKGTHIGSVKESHDTKVVSGFIKGNSGLLQGNIDGELHVFDKIEFKVLPKLLNLMRI